MSETPLYNIKGEVIGKETLPDVLFGVKPKLELIQFVVRAHRANKREPWAHTKNRGDVSGGGKKPWKQKGTGRARQGSIRSPQWKGGGVAFGPRKERNYEIKINQKVKEKALRMVLTDKAESKKIVLLDSFEIQNPKTKDVQKMLKVFKLKSVLMSLGKNNEGLIRAFKNIPKVGVLSADSLNVYDLLKYEYFVLDQEALKKIKSMRKIK